MTQSNEGIEKFLDGFVSKTDARLKEQDEKLAEVLKANEGIQDVIKYVRDCQQVAVEKAEEDKKNEEESKRKEEMEDAINKALEPIKAYLTDMSTTFTLGLSKAGVDLKEVMENASSKKDDEDEDDDKSSVTDKAVEMKGSEPSGTNPPLSKDKEKNGEGPAPALDESPQVNKSNPEGTVTKAAEEPTGGLPTPADVQKSANKLSDEDVKKLFTQISGINKYQKVVGE